MSEVLSDDGNQRKMLALGVNYPDLTCQLFEDVLNTKLKDYKNGCDNTHEVYLSEIPMDITNRNFIVLANSMLCEEFDYRNIGEEPHRVAGVLLSDILGSLVEPIAHDVVGRLGSQLLGDVANFEEPLRALKKLADKACGSVSDMNQENAAQ